MSQVCGRAVVLYGGMLMEEAPVAALFASPRQPYTRALLACVPRLSDAPGEINSIEGSPPVAGRLGPGCPVRAALYAADRAMRRAPARARECVAPRRVLEGRGMTALLELDGIGKTYELERRLLPRIFGASRPLAGGEGREPAGRTRRRARPGRRERLRQVDAGADHHAAGTPDQRHDPLRRHGYHGAGRARLAAVSPPFPDGVPGLQRPRSTRARRFGARSAKA